VAAQIALLRAVNVGGRSLKMAELAAFMRDLGFADAKTLLQSGNLVFSSGGDGGEALERRFESEAEKRLALPTDFIVRGAREWFALIDNNPFSEEAKSDPAHLVVAPLKAAPASGALEALQAAIVGRERVAIVGREAYLVYPDGIGNSKLTLAIIEKKLNVRTTMRNWNTVLKLEALAETLTA
jgi:uncharacterized protein (DUF1697 family)